MEHLMKAVGAKWRSLGIRRGPIERRFTQTYRSVKARLENTHRGPGTLVFEGADPSARRVGIQLMGACDTESVFLTQRLIRANERGTFCIRNDGNSTQTRSDVLLQTLKDLPKAHTEEIMASLRLGPDHFRPRLFEQAIDTRELNGVGPFPKSVVVLTTGPDMVRPVYRHRASGILVDPGGFWFSRPLDEAKGDRAPRQWFARNFESIGRIRVEDYQDNLRQIVRELRTRTQAAVVVYNLLSIEPGTRRHAYAYVRDSIGIRLRAFSLALNEVADEIGIGVVDVDRVLRSHGIRDFVDLGHNSWGVFPMGFRGPVAQETYRAIKELGVFEA